MRVVRIFIVVVFFFLLCNSLVGVASQTLNGAKLRCCTLVQYPSVFVDVTNEGKFQLNGLAIEYLDKLEKLSNFTCSSISNLTDEVKFSEFVERMHRCSTDDNYSDTVCSCDIGTGGWMQTRERYDKVVFLPPFVHDNMRAVVHEDFTFKSSEGTFFLNTFTPPVWVAMAGLVAFFTILKLFDKRFEPTTTRFRPLDKSHHWFYRLRHTLLKAGYCRRPRKSLQSTAGRLIGQPSDGFTGDSRTTRQWFLNFVISLCGIFFALTYEASMTAKLVQETVLSPFSSIEDLKMCRIPAEDVCLTVGGSVHTFWKDVIAPGYDRCEMNSVPQLCSSYDIAISKVANKTCKYMFADGITASYAVYGAHCGKILYTGTPSFLSRQGFILPLNSPYKSVLSRDTLRLAEMDKLTTIEQFYDSHHTCSIPTETTITMGKLKLFFISAYIVCTLIFIEMIVDPQKPRQDWQTDSVGNESHSPADEVITIEEEEEVDDDDNISTPQHEQHAHKIDVPNREGSITSSIESNRAVVDP